MPAPSKGDCSPGAGGEAEVIHSQCRCLAQSSSPLLTGSIQTQHEFVLCISFPPCTSEEMLLLTLQPAGTLSVWLR